MMPKYVLRFLEEVTLKDFTKQEIGVIIEEEFENRMTELSQITGSVIKE